MSFRIDESGSFRGTVSFLDLRPNNNCIANKHVDPAAALEASKLRHQHRAIVAQESSAACADEIHVAHVVHGAVGKSLAFKAGAVDPSLLDAICEVDLLKNGVSVLVGKIEIDLNDAAYALVEGNINTEALAADDVMEISFNGTVGGGTLANGVFAYFDCEEDFD